MKRTASSIITSVDAIKPNPYDEVIKLQWLNELEERVYQDIINQKSGTTETFTQITSANKGTLELVIPTPYTSVYEHYIVSQIDYYNQDFDLYNNSASMFNTALQEFAAHYRRSNPAKAVMLADFKY